MNIERYKAEFNRGAKLFWKMNTDSGCCKWDGMRAPLFKRLVEYFEKAEPVIGEKGLSQEFMKNAAIAASTIVAQEKVERHKVLDVATLKQIYEPTAQKWIETLNDYAVSAVKDDGMRIVEI